MSYLNAESSSSKEELLRDIISASQQAHMPGLPLRPFAALMVKLATEGGETISDLKAHITRLNDENAKLQWWVVALAIAALVSTLVQTVIAIVAFVNPPATSVSIDPRPTTASASPTSQPMLQPLPPAASLSASSPSPLPPRAPK